jgi:hypothetical protein
MRDIIRRHNRLNGLVFSIVEFGLISLFTGSFATYYLIHMRWVMAFIGWGITLNCLPVIIYGLRQLAEARARGESMGSYYSDKSAREQHRRENPHKFADAMILMIAVLIPFLMLVAVIWDKPKRQT